MEHTPSGGAATDSATKDGRPMSIGAVLHLLREEFPEVTISKIRFLEAEGLVEPQRTPSGYRKFSARDVERLSYVLRMQRDHYLPLKVIREHLDALARGEQPVLPVRGARSGGRPDSGGVAKHGGGGGTGAAALAAARVVRVGREELLAAAGIDEDELAGWESYGLIAPAGDGTYDISQVTVARLAADLGRFGLGPRHLRAVKAAADREAGLVEQVVAPLRRHQNPRTRAVAEERARELAGLSVRLHAALMRAALRLPATP